MQEALTQPFPPALKRSHLAVCFSGGSCTAALRAGEKSALGLSPGHPINPVELQMPGSQLFKGWGPFGGLVPTSHNKQSNKRNSSARGREQKH